MAAKTLARVPQRHVLQGLPRLDARGEIALHTGGLPVRLRQWVPHPHDRALHGAVRDRIRASRYVPEQALPTGLRRVRTSSAPRTARPRFLTADGTLRFDAR